MNGKIYIKVVVVSVLVSIASCSLLYVILSGNTDRIAMVDAVRLFNEYTMKIELEKQVAGRLNYLEKQRDSISQDMKIKAGLLTPKDQQLLIGAYEQKQQQIESEYVESNQTINEIVWKRLNPIIEEFGRSQKLHLVIGANGMGSVLYHDDYYDLTDELIDYVNKSYENKN